ncbi:MAG: hypothetical protein AUG49_06010 [Catenulispora sp. 13_1_20CM_3_70_7]|nr:MAG: hypothetical protein AUG49_06010 [Catenulispora sp. 13_1_20CM_3_70_7]
MDQYQADLTLVGTDLTTFIAQNGGQLLLDVIGVDDVEKCFGDGDVEGCLWSVGDAVTLALPVLKLWEVPEIMAKIAEIAPKVAKFLDDVRKAKKDLQRLRDLIEAEKRARELEAQKNKGCLKDGAGWIDYGATEPGQRATTVKACLTNAMLNTGTSTGLNGPYSPGFRWAQRYAAFRGLTPAVANPSQIINRCHLLAKELGGSGTDVRNLSTCARDVNAEVDPGDLGQPANMKDFETAVAALLGKQDIVEYTVTPLYDGPRTVPYAYTMSATAWLSSGAPDPAAPASVTLSNILDTPTGPYNLGRVTSNGQPVPLPGME